MLVSYRMFYQFFYCRAYTVLIRNFNRQCFSNWRASEV